MNFSNFLESKRNDLKELVKELRKTFKFVSILGTDIKGIVVSANKNSSNIKDGPTMECGFVIKMTNGKAFFEYSLNNIEGDKKVLAKKIIDSLELDKSIEADMISSNDIEDPVKACDYRRDDDFNKYSENDILTFYQAQKVPKQYN